MATDELPPPQETIQQLLSNMIKFEASDLHLKVNYSPYYRVGGILRKIEMPPIPGSAWIEQALRTLVPPTRRHEYDEHGDLDFSYRLESGDRFRVSIFRATGEMHSAVRRVNNYIPSFEELNLPPIYSDVVERHIDGLFLVTGVTGCGKSTTLACMIDRINELRGMHIITIEDPIEYVFDPKKSVISQREIGIDIPDYAEALRYLVRQDPDCIFIGEMRDKETILAALQAAETGHLVFGSLHVQDAQQTFNRILEFYPRTEHDFIRSSVANSLRGILCQRLLPGIGEGTRYPACEILLNNSTVEDKIRNEEDEDIPAIIEQSTHEGMRSFTLSLAELVEKEMVHYDTAMAYAPTREALASKVKGISVASQSLIGRVRHRSG